MKMPHLSLEDQDCWHRYLPMVGILLFSQLVFILGTWVGWRMLPAAYPSVTVDDQKFGLFVSSHFRWDALHYITIARDGYRAPADQADGKLPAFFPLFPFCVRLISGVLGAKSIHAVAWVAILFNLLAGLGALILIYNLAVEAGLDSSSARWATLFMAIYPLAVFLAVPYTEALFLLLSAAFFLFVHKRKWIWAGITAGLLSATRVTGVLFAILLCLSFLFSHNKEDYSPKEVFRGIIALVLSLSGLVAFMAYLEITFSDPFAFLHSQSYWKRGVELPFVTLWRGITYAFHPSWTKFFDQYLINTLHTAFIVLFIVVAIASFRRWHWLYQVYGWLLFSVALISPLQGSATMQSTARYMLVFFPLCFTLAEWGKRAWVRKIIFAVWIFMFAFMAALYGRGFFIG
jgi:Gpi18-like mannosyltransferase